MAVFVAPWRRSKRPLAYRYRTQRISIKITSFRPWKSASIVYSRACWLLAVAALGG